MRIPVSLYERYITYFNDLNVGAKVTLPAFGKKTGDAISSKLKLSYYFAYPYSFWERGLNEYTNKLIRQYFPKQMELDNVSINDNLLIINKLNSIKRNIYGFKTPNYLFINIFMKINLHLVVECTNYLALLFSQTDVMGKR